MPGDRYEGDDPEGALTRDEFVSLLEDYAARHALPVERGTVTEVAADGDRYLVRTADRTMSTPCVVVASGSLNRPRRPAMWQRISPAVHQVDASDYRSAASLDAGAVLVVGSAQSGGQIAKDLADAGRSVFLATGQTGRLPWGYRGRNLALWLIETGRLDQRREEFALPSGEIPGRPLQGALETISLQSLSAQGVVLLGRMTGADGKLLSFSDDVASNIRFGDEASAAVRRRIDDYIAQNGISAPPPGDDPAEAVRPIIPMPAITSLDLAASNVSTIIWCTGFDGDFSWLRVSGALGADQMPVHVDGVGAAPGLYFPGLDFASTRKSGTILAVAEESRTIAEHIARRLGQS